MKIRRNDPCFCGSGKKYKKCCMGRSEEHPLQDIKDDVHDLLEGRSFGSMEELQNFLNQYNQEKNNAAVDEFHGLSPAQMHSCLHMPFEAPELVTFEPVLQTSPKTKAGFLLGMLIEEIGEEGTKLTAKGNLGQKFCQKASKDYFDLYPDSLRLNLSVRSEDNFEPLHTIRLTAQLAGLVRKRKGTLLLTKKCLKLYEQSGVKELYPLLMQAYLSKFNWAYRDGYGEIYFIQQSFLFTLYMLSKYGEIWRPATFYSENFLRAFPMVLQEIDPKPYQTKEVTLTNVYFLRVLKRFADFFGLADVEEVSKDPLNRDSRIRSTDLLGEMVEWNLLN